MRRIGRWLALLLLALMSALLFSPSLARAARNTGNYQLDLQVTNGPFSYGGSTLPRFKATLTALNGTTLSTCTGSTFVTVSIDTDPGTAWGSTSQSAPDPSTCAYTYVDEPPDWSHYATGLRTATARATVSGQVVATGTVTFMVNKIVTTIKCFVNTPGTVFQAGSTLQIEQQVQGPNTNYTPDWTQSKFDITLTGPESVTYTNITPDTTPGAGWLYVKAPTTPGNYNMKCTFDGYGDYAPSTSNTFGVAISSFHQIAGIKLYTNPTTYNPYKSCDVYIVFQAAPGGPAPTGRSSITIGRNYTATMNIAANGTLSVRLAPLQLPGGADQITVYYMGDSYYRWTNSNFSFINPPIPSGTKVGGNSQGTATAQGTASETSTTESGTPTAVGAGNVVPTTGSQSGDNGGPALAIILAALVLVALGLTAGIAIYLIRRRALAAPGGSGAAPMGDNWPNSPPGQWDATGRWNPGDQREMRGQWDDDTYDTYPYRRGDR